MPRPRRRSAFVQRLRKDPTDVSQPAILRELRRCLLEGDAPPGTSIPLDEVAAFFGVSHIPVRESLKTLIGENLIAHRPNTGYEVARITVQELRELYVVRQALESVALRAAVAVADEAEQRAAVMSHQALAAAVEANDPRSYQRDSRDFHLALVRPCRMYRLLHVVEAAWNTTEPLQAMTHIGPDGRALLHEDHSEMLRAFLARDATALLAASDAHHERLAVALAALPTDTGLFAD